MHSEETIRSAQDGASYTFPRVKRISQSSEIISILSGGSLTRGKLVDFFFTDAIQAYSRVGIIVPKYNNTIVERNKLKRQLREIVRLNVLNQSDLVKDLIVRCRREAYGASFNELVTEVLELVGQIKRLDENGKSYDITSTRI